MSLLLLFRSIQGTPYGSYWGPHFPRKSRGHDSYWNRHFPDEPSLTVPPTGPAAPTNFALILAKNASLTSSWRTGVFKSYSGKERRSSTVDDPALWFEGAADLVGANTRTMRAQLATRAASGLPFLLGLPHEEMSLRAGSTGAVVPVYDTTKSDWCLVGQPVYVVHQTRGSVYGVIQAVSSNTITLDVSPELVGSRGARIMPAVPVYLDPQQGFARYPTTDAVETMQIKARLANAGYAQQALWATLALTGTAAGVVLRYPTAGADGNSLEIQFVGDAVGTDYVDVSTPNLIVYHFVPGVTTVQGMCSRLERTDLVIVLPLDPSERSTDVLLIGDAFGPTALSGGADFAIGEIGASATVIEWNGRPVWDRGLLVEGSVPDSLHSMTEVTDLGGLPLSSSSASQSDWGRTINARGDFVSDWQWLRKMLDTLRGAWRGFWLTTARADLVPVSVAAGELTVSAGESDVFAWWPLQRAELEIVQSDGVVTRVAIADAIDNGDDTVTLSIVDESAVAVTLSGTAITSVSWLEVVRLETDVVKVAIAQGQWNTSIQGRAIQNLAGVETEPREALYIVHGTTEYFIATGTRSAEVDGDTYEPVAAGRDSVAIHTVADDQPMELHVHVLHPLAQRYMAGGVPPREVRVEVRRLVGVTWTYAWRGWVTSMSVDGHIARLIVPSEIDVAVRRRLPVLSVGRGCGHVLYNADCRADRASFTVTSTIAAVDGRNVRCDIALDDTWARGGELVHVPSGEPMSIFEHRQTIDLAGQHANLTLQAQIYGMQVGDAVEISAGCRHDIQTCRNVFDNVPNYGPIGPLLPTVNPFKPVSTGAKR